MPKKFLHRWARHNDGTTAIEFSLLAIPFAMLLVGIIEISLLFANASVLEGAVHDGARLIRTGQAQTADDPEEAFRNAVCEHAFIIDCDELQYHVTTLDNFGAAAETVPMFDEDGNMEDPGFVIGGSGDIVLIRVSYLYPLMTPLIGNIFSDYPGNRRMLMATIVMQSEPYEF